ncbi:hypothetical protein KAR91_66710 [Candidatus Pacearchaeota archaeon]|nr:hypothetical protein [Candidatus Pacearchaeota archaeon]
MDEKTFLIGACVIVTILAGACLAYKRDRNNRSIDRAMKAGRGRSDRSSCDSGSYDSGGCGGGD